MIFVQRVKRSVFFFCTRLDDPRLVREVQALPLISANMIGGSGLNRMYTFHSNVLYVYVQASGG